MLCMITSAILNYVISQKRLFELINSQVSLIDMRLSLKEALYLLMFQHEKVVLHLQVQWRDLEG